MKEIPAPFFTTLINESMKVPAHVWRGVFNGLVRSDTKNNIAKVKKPTMIIWGTKDVMCPAEDQDALLKAIKGSFLVVYEGHGHDTHWEDPERFSIDLSNFVRTIKVK